ncbi:PAS domain-containing protein [Methanogenium sp. S4BF]|uniref:PAS domain-containing sensor histidine kinase n=1 Tax=Methanogenium sp. S4BF TaxID=1789226 RepID=UPI00241755C4|nr:PAS domain-containing protein [Methanogenium sp. S4BF]WFN34310.1 PAS domain-containing protein [Methanogenium sp. S4BF]
MIDAFLPLLPDALPEAVVLVDRDLNLLYGNAEALRQAGCTKGEFCKKRCYYVWGEGGPCIVCPVRTAFDTEKPVKEEITVPSGRVHRIHAVPIQEADGSVPYVLMTCFEISDPNSAIRLNTEAQERLSLALSAGRIGTFEADITGRKIIVDDRFARIIGTTPEALGTDPRMVFDCRVYPRDRKRMGEILAGIVSGEQEHTRTECRFWHEDKRWIWVRFLMQVTKRDENGHPMHLAGVMHDISDICRAKQSMKKAVQKTNLLSSIARHDLMNQMRVIKLTRARLQEEHPEIAAEIQAYQKTCTRATEIIESLVAFTAAYRDMGVHEPRWHPLEDLISRVYAENEQFHSFSLEIKRPLPRIYSDRLIERVFFSLFENIIIHSGGADRVTISFQDNGDEGSLFIADNGKGIPSAMKKKIFERGIGEDTGYGLFLGREILEVAGVMIEECGTEGEGAVFRCFGPPDTYRSLPKPNHASVNRLL